MCLHHRCELFISFRQWTYLAPERSWLNRRQKCGSEIWVTYVYNSALPEQFPHDCRHFLQTRPTAVSLWVLKSTTRSNIEAHDFSDRVRERGWGTQWTTNSSRCMTTAEKRMPRTISGGLAGARGGDAQISGLSVYPGGGAWRSPGSTSAGPSKLVRS